MQQIFVLHQFICYELTEHMLDFEKVIIITVFNFTRTFKQETRTKETTTEVRSC